MRIMQLDKILDAIISKEVYKEVKVECRLPYYPFELVEDIVEKIKTDEDFGKEYKEELSKQLQEQGYEHSEVIGIDSYSNCLVVRYTAYYAGRKEHPEVHLKTLLSLYERQGRDIHDPDVFDEIVEKARRDLGERIKNHNEERLDRFAALFKEAIVVAQSPMV